MLASRHLNRSRRTNFRNFGVMLKPEGGQLRNTLAGVCRGAKDRRPALDGLVLDAKRRRFDVLVCWRLDRLGRNLRHLITRYCQVEENSVDRAPRCGRSVRPRTRHDGHELRVCARNLPMPMYGFAANRYVPNILLLSTPTELNTSGLHKGAVEFVYAAHERAA